MQAELDTAQAHWLAGLFQPSLGLACQVSQFKVKCASDPRVEEMFYKDLYWFKQNVLGIQAVSQKFKIFVGIRKMYEPL